MWHGLIDSGVLNSAPMMASWCSIRGMMALTFMLAMGVVASAGELRTNSDREGWWAWLRAGEEGGELIVVLMM